MCGGKESLATVIIIFQFFTLEPHGSLISIVFSMQWVCLDTSLQG